MSSGGRDAAILISLPDSSLADLAMSMESEVRSLNLCSKFSYGDLNDYDTIVNFGSNCDIITFEIEHINVDALDTLVKMGKKGKKSRPKGRPN